MEFDNPVMICIESRAPQYDGDEDFGPEIAEAYTFSVLEGSMADAMAMLKSNVDRPSWMGDVAPSEDGCFICFDYGVWIEVGDVFDIRVGPPKRRSTMAMHN